MRVLLRFLFALVISSMFATAVVVAQTDAPQGGPPPPPPMRAIPGLTADDPHPKACVDCHVVMKDVNKDERISTLMAKWNEQVEPKLLRAARAAAPDSTKITGKHPKAAASLKNIPGGCLMCHGKDSKTAPPFSKMLHTIHLTGGAENHFITYYQGDCTHCHKLDKTNGKWSVPSAPEP